MGTGSYLPEKILTNGDLEAIVDTTDEWIRQRTGIKSRHIAADGETTCDLAEKAARNALQVAGVSAHDIDLLVLGTTTPDLIFPGTACMLQDRLGCHGIGAMDVNAACSGFVYALSIADKFVRSGASRRALVVGAETLSRMVDWTDRSTCVLFGDGAGAVVLEPADEPGILSTHIHADGSYWDRLKSTTGLSKGLLAEANGGVYIRMQGNEIFKIAVRTLGRIVDETLSANGLGKKDVDWLIPHQANHRIIAATAKKLDMHMDRVIVTVDRHANTSAASVPLALDYAVTSGKVQRGDLILLEAFGGGVTWGSALIRY